MDSTNLTKLYTKMKINRGFENANFYFQKRIGRDLVNLLNVVQHYGSTGITTQNTICYTNV